MQPGSDEPNKGAWAEGIGEGLKNPRDTMTGGSPSQQVVIIRPSQGRAPLRLRELWVYRELLYFLVWRDIKVRYKGAVLGLGWAVLQPLLMTLVFTFLIGIVGIPSNGIPPAILVFSALLPWNLFAKGLTEGSQSLVANEQLVTKVYFPRLLLPIAPIATGLVDFAIGFAVLLALMAYFGIIPAIAIVAVPAFAAIAIICAVGIALWLSAIDILYRDVRHVVPFIAGLWFFATPIFYPLSLVPDSLRWLYSLNPMVIVVEGFRWALFGAAWRFDFSVGISLAVVTAMFVGGLFYFRRTERVFADWGRP